MLGVDIGGSKIAIGQVDCEGHLRGSISSLPVPFDIAGPASVEGVIRLLQPFVEEAQTSPDFAQAIGLSLCGNIDMQTGEAVLIPNLHWRNIPFGGMLKDRLGVQIYPAGDVRLAALAEVIWGAARGARHFAWVTVGTGYGAYLYLDGKLYGGAHTFAGNFGHNTIDEANGYPCGCGRRGCVETYVAGPAIARAGQKAMEAGRSPCLSKLAGDGKVTCQMVFEAEAAGDPAAEELLAQVIRMIAISLGSLVNTLDLELIVLGGGVMRATPTFRDRIAARTRDYLMTEEAKRDLRILDESFPNSAVFGAAAHVFVERGLLVP